MTNSTAVSVLAALALAGTMGVAAAQQGTTASLVSRDSNEDGALSKQEFMATDAVDFEAFDTDDSGDISESEFDEGMFDMADTDDSGTLEPDEMEAFDTVRGVNGVSQ